jgi:hypothetical protein
MLDAIRQLTQNLKLKDLIIANFIPEEMAKNIEKRATWNVEEDSWTLQVFIIPLVEYPRIKYLFTNATLEIRNCWESNSQ